MNFLDRSFARFRILPQQDIRAACDRVLSRLRDEMERDPAAVVPIQLAAPRSRRWRFFAVAAAAAVLIFAMLSLRPRNGQDAVVHLADGQTFTTAADIGTMVSLPDSSRVEMRSEASLSVERVSDGLRVQLNKGSVIVNAPSRRARQLYVRTRDLTVVITGTVFLVDAQEAGSRVAVIQGTVRVQLGSMETNLAQGEQLVSNQAMQSGAIPEEIGWSRDVQIHLDQLQYSHKTIEERCGPQDLRSIVRENGGWNLRLPLILWRKYRCQHEGDNP